MMFLNVWIKRGMKSKTAWFIQLSYHNEDKKTHLSSMVLLFNVINGFSIMS